MTNLGSRRVLSFISFSLICDYIAYRLFYEFASVQTLQSHFRSLGGAWSIAFYDYYVNDLTEHIHDDIVMNKVNGLWNYEDMFREFN